MSLKTDLLSKADAYCAEHGLTRAALGHLIMNDNKFFGDVAENTRGFTVTTYERVLAAIKKSPEELKQAREAADRRSGRAA